jgi:tungstate transport system substrate-binding protein
VSLCAGDAVEYLKNPKSEVVDVVITHEMDIAKKLVADSVCVNLRELHYSNCVLVGPKEDPAGIKGMKDPTEALKIIAKKQQIFFSRGDNSGTHGVEKKMWRLSNVLPNGDWYITTFAGTDATLIIANRKRGYTIVHYPSFLQMQETLNMEVMVYGNYDNKMITDYQITVINPQKFSGAMYEAGEKFSRYLTSPEIQSYIAYHSIDLFKCQTNFPLAVKVEVKVDEKNN